jgi:hypothetical protein
LIIGASAVLVGAALCAALKSDESASNEKPNNVALRDLYEGMDPPIYNWPGYN